MIYTSGIHPTLVSFVKRPEQHEIDEAGPDLLRGALRPLGCALNRIENDYGRDFDAEVFKDGGPLRPDPDRPGALE